MLVLIYGPLAKQEINYQTSRFFPADKTLTPIDTNFGIIIPKINVNSKIVKDVDPYDSSIYQRALTKGVAHALGSSYPGHDGNVFVFSHSSSDILHASLYNSIFYLLPKLEIGDSVILYFQNTPFRYTVTKKYITDPSNISILENHSTDKTLTLMTCYPPGTDLKRFVVEAVATSPQ